MVTDLTVLGVTILS